MVSTATVAQYLEGLDFPASKQEVISYAEERNAPPDILDALHGMPEPPDVTYFSMASIWDAVGVTEVDNEMETGT